MLQQYPTPQPLSLNQNNTTIISVTHQDHSENRCSMLSSIQVAMKWRGTDTPLVWSSHLVSWQVLIWVASQYVPLYEKYGKWRSQSQVSSWNISDTHLILYSMHSEILAVITQSVLSNILTGNYGVSWVSLTHWGWVTHIYISNLMIIGSDNGLSPGWCLAII